MEMILSALVITGVSAGWLLYKRHKHDAHLLTNQPSLRLNGGCTYQYSVVGVSRYQSTLKSIYGKDEDDHESRKAEATLIVEDKNGKDKTAVRVEIEDRTVGYLPNDVAAEYRLRLVEAGYMDTRGVCRARIAAHRSHNGSGFEYSVRLDLPPKAPRRAA
jgi:hypothetical protein